MVDTEKIHPATGLVQHLSSSTNCEDFSPLSETPYLFLDITKPEATIQKDPASFLKNFQCPIIGIGHSNSPLAQACDVIINSSEKAGSIIENIKTHPLTAAISVQLLRHNERVSVNDGLFAESLAYATLQASTDFRSFLKTRKIVNPVADSGPAVLINRQENCLVLTLNRPNNHNAFSIAMRDRLSEGLNLLAQDKTLQKAILNGAGKCFCTGGELSEFGAELVRAQNLAAVHLIRSTRNVGRQIYELADRIECHIQGACIGSGIELPAFSHHIIASKQTYFQLPELTMGLIPGAGGTVSILKRIGRHKTAYMILSAKRINSRTALEWGLIDEILEKTRPTDLP